MTVYIVQELRGRNFSDATSFGDCEILLPADVQTYSTALFVVSGRSCCHCAMAARINNNRFKMLKWDRVDEKYYPLEADITGKKVTDEKI